MLCTIAGTLNILVALEYHNDVCSYLESEMLKEVSCTICFVCFCSAPSINPDTNGRSLGPRRMLSCNLNRSEALPSLYKRMLTCRQAVGERGTLCCSSMTERRCETSFRNLEGS